jgi:hypothetical protein
VTILLAVALCRGLSLPVGCLQLFLVIVLDLMTRPHRRPFFLFVNAFRFPREERLYQYPLLCDVDVDGLLRLFRPVRLPCFLVSGSKQVDTGKAYPPAPSEAVLWIPLSGVAPMF